MTRTRYRFKRAETQDELDQIFRLNHTIFAEELEQHQVQSSGILIDKFHDKNFYIVATVDEAAIGAGVIGMVALHHQPPFSVAAKLADPESVLPKLGSMIEVRLLAVQPAHRNGRVMAGLMLELYKQARAYDTIVISGHADKASIYRELGFRDLGPAVKSGEALYIPMAMPVSDLAERQARWERRLGV